MAEYEALSSSPEDTQRLGERLGRLAWPRLVVALRGGLGAGKTQFVRGVARGLGVPDPRIVTSPTFVIVHEYDGRLPLYHFDAYRLTHLEAIRNLGFEEYFDSEGVSIVEWADRLEPLLPDDRLDITLDTTGATTRRLAVMSLGSACDQLAATWLGKDAPT